MTCHTLRRVLLWTLAVAFCSAWLVPGSPGAADKGKARSLAAKPASQPADQDQLPQLSDNDLKQIGRHLKAE